MRSSEIQLLTVLRMLSRQWIAASAFGCVVVWLAVAGNSQTVQKDDAKPSGLKNGGFEELDAAGLPTGWVFPPQLKAAGYKLATDDSNPLAGKHSGLVDSTGVKEIRNSFGNLMQPLDARPYRGQRVRFRAAVRTAELAEGGRAQLWFRVDRTPSGGRPVVGAFDNMSDRPIRDGEWKRFDIVAQIDDEAEKILLGLLLLGTGKAWIDDATLEVVP